MSSACSSSCVAINVCPIDERRYSGARGIREAIVFQGTNELYDDSDIRGKSLITLNVEIQPVASTFTSEDAVMAMGYL